MPYVFYLFIILIFTSPAYAPAYAKDKPSTNEEVSASLTLSANFNELKHTKSARVDQVIDGLTVLLKDKTILRLASLDIPDFNNSQSAPYAEAAQTYLNEALPEGTEIMIYQTRMAKKGRINRMNHQLGHIVTKKDSVWMNGALLSKGLARVYTAPNAPEMNVPMLEIEEKARASNVGFWKKNEEESEDNPYSILTPDTAEKAMGKLAIIEGIVQKTASVRNNIYLNFGANWKDDFTIMITPTLRKKLAHNGIAPLALAHKKLRVRGYLRDYNGPLIELEAIEHLEYPLLHDNGETPILEN